MRDVPTVKAGNQGIVRPIRSSRAPKLGPLAFLVSSGKDLEALVSENGLDQRPARQLYHGRLIGSESPCCLAGPVIGASYAVMILETLVAWGTSSVVFFGWCGAIRPEVTIGDILIVSGAWIDEGTSLHYGADPGAPALPSDALRQKIRQTFREHGAGFVEGTVWSTDGVFRETPDKVMGYREKEALAVEMETSALFSAARFLGVAAAAVLVVSDDLSSLQWKPGFKDKRFQESRAAVREIIGYLWRKS